MSQCTKFSRNILHDWRIARQIVVIIRWDDRVECVIGCANKSEVPRSYPLEESLAQ